LKTKISLTARLQCLAVSTARTVTVQSTHMLACSDRSTVTESSSGSTEGHWRRQLWGTGARAPLDFQLVILEITRFTDSDES